MSFDTAEEKKDREDLVSLAKPQGGVDAMADLFPNAKPVPGVTDVKFGGLGMCQAIRTSLVVIAMSSIAGLGAHLAHGNGPSVELAIPLTITAVFGMAAGNHTARYVSGGQLRRGFAGFVTTVGSALIFVNGPTTIRLLG